MELLAVVTSAVALLVSIGTLVVEHRLGRHANSLPLFLEIFRRHQDDELVRARRYIHDGMPGTDANRGFEGIPETQRENVRALAWFYDQVGALVTHDVVDLDPVSAYLGGSVLYAWSRLQPLIEVERAKRHESHGMRLWQEYFENLVWLLRDDPPLDALRRQQKWRVPRNRFEIVGADG